LLAGNSNLIEFEPQEISYDSVLSDLIIVKDVRQEIKKIVLVRYSEANIPNLPRQSISLKALVIINWPLAAYTCSIQGRKHWM